MRAWGRAGLRLLILLHQCRHFNPRVGPVFLPEETGRGRADRTLLASPGCVVPHCGHFRRFGAICHSQPSFWQPFFSCRRGFPLRPLMAARRQQQVQTKTRLATTTSNGPSARGTRRAGTRTRPPVRRSRRAGGGVRGDDPRRRPARDDPRRRGDDPSRPWRRDHHGHQPITTTMATLRFKTSS